MHYLKLHIPSLILVMVSSFCAHASWPLNDTTKYLASDTVKPVILADDPTIIALDALWQSEVFRWQAFEGDSNVLNVHGFKWDSIPIYSAAEIEAKLRLLNDKTPFDLKYNAHVQAYINVYVIQRRAVTSRVLGLAALYYPMFEETLDQFDIPLELKHLAVVESALNPNARSRAGATGLWQFMFTTGKMYGLQVDTYVDERSDPLKSTVAACRYMKLLYRMYNDWNLVLAAYNAGPGNVNKAIRRSGGKKDYWEISPYLPRETRSYVPTFIAANYVMNHAADHNIYPSMPAFLFSEIDTIHISRETSFAQLALVTGIPVESLQLLNPSLKRNVIPKTDVGTVVYLPIEATGKYLANVKHMHELPIPAPELTDQTPAPAPAVVVETHVVRSGESLGLIAQRYKVSVTDLKEWNNLSSTTLRIGQKLQIQMAENQKQPVKPKAPQVQTAVLEKPNNSTSTDGRYHVIQSGDTLWDIAKKYPGISANDIIKANSGVSGSTLRPGQKIVIPPAS